MPTPNPSAKPHPTANLPKNRRIRKLVVAIARARANSARAFPHLVTTRYPETATIPAYIEHGRGFFSRVPRKTVKGRNGRTYQVRRTQESYESRFVMGVIVRVPQGERAARTELAKVSLGFSNDAVVVEAMQNRKGVSNMLNEFRRRAKQHAIDFVLAEVEKRARELGFSEIKIRRPETLAFYDRPVVGKRNATAKERAEIQRGLRRFYGSTAHRNLYKREGLFYVKRLS